MNHRLAQDRSNTRIAVVSVLILLFSCWWGQKHSIRLNEDAARSWLAHAREVSMPERRDLHVSCTTSMCQLMWTDRDYVTNGPEPRRATLVCSAIDVGEAVCIERNTPCPRR